MLVEELVDNGMATLKEGMLSIGLNDFYALSLERDWLSRKSVGEKFMSGLTARWARKMRFGMQRSKFMAKRSPRPAWHGPTSESEKT